MTRALAEGLGQAGFVVVSGLARGVDTAAHRAALPTGTVAVMAGGVDHIYPAENAALAAEIAANGLRLSEQPIGFEPQARHFPARNRIVSGLAHAVVVVEAAERSGSLITARTAADQGREVMAVPGHPMDPRASGCNLLIRDGATLVRSAEDVIEALAPALDGAMTAPATSTRPEPVTRPPERDRLDRPQSAHTPDRPRPGRRVPGTNDPQRSGLGPDLRSRILDRLGPSPLAEDQLIRDLGERAAVVAPVMTDLELEGRILRQPGGLLALVT
jgi:DNA processing protein